MSTATEPLPITETVEPADQQELIETVRRCFETETPLYPIGGGTSLDFGLPAKQPGIGLSLARLDRVVDYPARDMTITVEAGTRMQTLAQTLAAERQRLPIDVPRPALATLGGVVATNFNGPRRYGHGGVRDHVIGISAVDGRGKPFQGGGRVVKNVAGYDFCKLLTGSLGTLGVISQLTVKLKPVPEQLTVVLGRLKDLDEAERLLAGLVQSQTSPVAIELLCGPVWQSDPAIGDGSTHPCPLHLLVALEGTRDEVVWMAQQLDREWRAAGVVPSATIEGEQAADLMLRLAEFPAEGEPPLVLKASVVPSATTKLIAAALDSELDCSIQAHAGSGVIVIRVAEFPASGLSRTLVGGLQAVAIAAHGSIIVLANPSGTEVTHRAVWGTTDGPFWLMDQVKQKFDPKNLLNPGRFVYQQL